MNKEVIVIKNKYKKCIRGYVLITIFLIKVIFAICILNKSKELEMLKI